MDTSLLGAGGAVSMMNFRPYLYEGYLKSRNHSYLRVEAGEPPVPKVSFEEDLWANLSQSKPSSDLAPKNLSQTLQGFLKLRSEMKKPVLSSLYRKKVQPKQINPNPN